MNNTYKVKINNDNINVEFTYNPKTEDPDRTSDTLDNLITDVCDDNTIKIEIPCKFEETIKRVIYYLTNAGTGKDNDENQKIDNNTVKDLPIDNVIDLLKVANFLSITDLIEIAAKRSAEILKNMSGSELLKLAGHPNGLTDEEKEELKNHPWLTK